jgi:hypothetical protein
MSQVSVRGWLPIVSAVATTVPRAAAFKQIVARTGPETVF